MRGRNNPLRNVADAEINAKLASVVEWFGENWLEKGSKNPVQRIWHRQDGLATDELVILGDALQRLESENERWVQKTVNKIKTADDNNRSGAVFELIGLSLFEAGDQKVTCARDSNPGYDGEIVFQGGQRLLLSLKSYGDSVHEREIVRQSRLVEATFASAMQRTSRNGLGIRILATTFPSQSDWNSLRSAISSFTEARSGASSAPFAINNIWGAMIHPLADSFSPLSAQYLSYVMLVLVPFHKNEQQNLIAKVEAACANFAAHPGPGSPQVCRAAFIRLPPSGSVVICQKTVRQYFSDTPDSPIDGVILYQPTVSRDLKTSQSIITHYLAFAGTVKFETWSATLPHPMSIRTIVGGVSTKPTQMMLNDGTISVPIDGCYAFQSGNVYREFRLNEKGESTSELGSPAPGVLTHAVQECLPGQWLLIQGKLPIDEHFEVLG
ncbi:MAG: hypothetical protein WAU82_04550 [Candidatus Binatus sp.]|uniref:hypothetical protein n=1 Tax=Candidatus Binatus sp. TaxID=2811406 RepID=UPI003BAE4FF9